MSGTTIDLTDAEKRELIASIPARAALPQVVPRRLIQGRGKSHTKVDVTERAFGGTRRSLGRPSQSRPAHASFAPRKPDLPDPAHHVVQWHAAELTRILAVLLVVAEYEYRACGHCDIQCFGCDRRLRMR